MEKPGPPTKLSTGDRRGTRMSARCVARGHSGVSEVPSLMSKGGRMRTAISAGALALALGGGISAVAAAPVSAAVQLDDCPQGGLLGTVTGWDLQDREHPRRRRERAHERHLHPAARPQDPRRPTAETTENGAGDTARSGDTAAVTSPTPNATAAPAPYPDGGVRGRQRRPAAQGPRRRLPSPGDLPRVHGPVGDRHSRALRDLRDPRPRADGRAVRVAESQPVAESRARNPRGRRRRRCRPSLPCRRRPGHSRRTRASR